MVQKQKDVAAFGESQKHPLACPCSPGRAPLIPWGVAMFWKALRAPGTLDVAITSLTRFELALFGKTPRAPGDFNVDTPR